MNADFIYCSDVVLYFKYFTMKNNKQPIEYTDSDESEEVDDSYLKKLEIYQAMNRKMTEQAKHVPE